ncbi:hypothetical protein KS4_31420 [Poriferisphaera corsica]|uniref:DUF1570 domain-containing protein n=1 Tax=Poriferisphaera corsica TaxID=2528020 RepID=A0A517YXV8_9BACT|nr:DUF1570 domain-containing protein [Poriferisphaera corsica]QDU35064.1 hypothetical protein KS4_31420 [Poriferisphaera corsica]
MGKMICDDVIRWAAVSMLVLGVMFGVGGDLYGQRTGRRERQRSITKQNMTSWESEHYKVYTNLEREAVEKYVEHLDEVYEAYIEFFAGYDVRKSGRNNAYLFATRQDMLNFLKRQGIDARHAGAMFVPGWGVDGLVVTVEGWSESGTMGVLRHEAFHQAAHQFMGDRLPTWMNEGLAEYFDTSWFVEGRFVEGVVDMDRVRSMRDAVKRGAFIRLDDLFKMTNEKWAKNMRKRVGGRRARVSSKMQGGKHQYTQSWLVVHFFMQHEKQAVRDAFEKYLRVIGRGRTHRQAYASAFNGVKMRDLERYWVDYVMGLGFDDFGEMQLETLFLGEMVWELFKKHGQTGGGEGGAGGGLLWQGESVLKEEMRRLKFEMNVKMDRIGEKRFTTKDEDVWWYQGKDGEKYRYEFEIQEGGAGYQEVWISAKEMEPAVRFKVFAKGANHEGMRFEMLYDWDGFGDLAVVEEAEEIVEVAGRDERRRR